MAPPRKCVPSHVDALRPTPRSELPCRANEIVRLLEAAAIDSPGTTLAPVVAAGLGVEAPSQRARRRVKALPPTHVEVERLGYQLWEARGCPTGSSDIDWYRAEQELSVAHGPVGSSEEEPAGGRVRRAPRQRAEHNR
jgi:hypothetical protein